MIADLPEIAVAAGMAIIVYITGKILIFVGQHFPNPNILGWHPLNFVQAGLQRRRPSADRHGRPRDTPGGGALLTPIHLFKSIFQRVVNAIGSAHDKVATLHNETIPAAQLKAEQVAANYTDTSIGQLNADLQSRIANAEQRITDLQQSIAVQIASGTSTAFQALDQNLLQRIQGDENIMSAITTEIATQLPLEIQTAVSDAQATEQQQLTSTADGLQDQIDSLSDAAHHRADRNSPARRPLSPRPDTELATLRRRRRPPTPPRSRRCRRRSRRRRTTTTAGRDDRRPQ